MARCPNCNKFVSLEPNAEILNMESDTDGDTLVVRGEARLVKECADCNEELEEAHCEFEEILEHECAKDFEIELEEGNMEPSTRYEGQGRGARTFYQVFIDIVISCSCGWKKTITTIVEEQASSFDSLL